MAPATTYDNFSAPTGTIVYDPDGPDPTDRPSAHSSKGMTLT
ncbi:MAG TPA: hypothetical protein VKA00_04025 [Trueperaceae bacterium]|nr:hypothetical protein [Trueperaceae bacterium]